jgi:hypothetical protein
MSSLSVDRRQVAVGDARPTVAVSTQANTMLRTTLKDILLFVLAYVLWLVTIVACVVAVIELRSTINVLWVMTGRSPWTLGLAEQLCVLLGGLVAFVYVLFLENYYRRSVSQQIVKTEAGNGVSPPDQRAGQSNNQKLRVLLQRFAWTVAIPIGLLVVLLVIREAALRGLY